MDETEQYRDRNSAINLASLSEPQKGGGKGERDWCLTRSPDQGLDTDGGGLKKKNPTTT